MAGWAGAYHVHSVADAGQGSILGVLEGALVAQAVRRGLALVVRAHAVREAGQSGRLIDGRRVEFRTVERLGESGGDERQADEAQQE